MKLTSYVAIAVVCTALAAPAAELPAISIVASPAQKDVPDTRRATLAFDLVDACAGRIRAWS